MLTRLLYLMVISVLATGCGIKAHTYVMTKERVDIEQKSLDAASIGNAGYLQGKPVYQEPEKKTRKVYILEITKAVSEGEVKKIQEEVTTTSKSNSTASHSNINVKMTEPSNEVQETTKHKANRIVIPQIEDTEANVVVEKTANGKIVVGPSEAMTYTVLKDDTLQKIAKKYYGSYGEWIKIYNTNKDKIKNPNLLKPGTVITLPAAK